MKKKTVAGCVIVVLLAIVVIAALGNQKYHQKDLENRQAIKPVEVADVPVTYEPVDTRFYDKQLTIQEKKIYNQITERLDQCKSGEIVLEQPIDARAYARIVTMLKYDRETYWYLYGIFPFDKENMLVDIDFMVPAKERNIYKMIFWIDSDKFRKEMTTYDKKNAENVKRAAEDLSSDPEAYKKAKEIADTIIDDNPSYYERTNKEIERNLQQIIDDMPKGLNQKEAIQYFAQWIVDHMTYESTVAKYLDTGDYAEYDPGKAFSSESVVSINTKQGTCGGFSLILVTLCNRVGIDAYVVRGEAFGEGHAWTAVKIGGETYYKDPTFEVGDKKVKFLATELQFYQYFCTTYKPYSHLFKY